MQTVLPGEDGRQREQRAQRERERLDAEIRRRDALTVPSEAAAVADAQIANRNLRRPLDYAAILKYRAIEPGLFTLLPSDEECRRALGLPLVHEGNDIGEPRGTLTLKGKK